MTRLQFLGALIAAPFAAMFGRKASKKQPQFVGTEDPISEAMSGAIAYMRERHAKDVPAVQHALWKIDNERRPIKDQLAMLCVSLAAECAHKNFMETIRGQCPKHVRVPLKGIGQKCGMVNTALHCFESGQISHWELTQMLARDVAELCSRFSESNPEFAAEVANHHRFLIGRPTLTT